MTVLPQRADRGAHVFLKMSPSPGVDSGTSETPNSTPLQPFTRGALQDCRRLLHVTGTMQRNCFAGSVQEAIFQITEPKHCHSVTAVPEERVTHTHLPSQEFKKQPSAGFPESGITRQLSPPFIYVQLAWPKDRGCTFCILSAGPGKYAYM